MRRVNTLIGSPIERVEDFRFLKGSGTYVDDLEREGTWHAAIVRSRIAHGRIRRIDGRAALAMPGVNAVFTAADMTQPVPTIPFRRPNPTQQRYAQPVIADEVVRYMGEPVAVVLADSAALAEDAALAVEVDIEPLPAVTDWQAAMKADVLLFPRTSDNNSATIFIAKKGDVDAAFRAAAYTRKDKFRVQRMTAMTMETRGLLAEWDDAKQYLTVAGAAKLPFFNRRAMASMLGLKEEQVDYIEYDVGGGFGARGEFYPEDFLVGFAARKYRRPVKWVEDRREHFLSIAHARETDCKVEMAFDKNGTILGLRGEMYCDIGAYVRPNGTTAVRNVVQFMSGPYRCANIDLKAHALITNKVPAGTYRAPGRFESCYFIERMLYMTARDLGLDQLDIRRRNLVSSAEMPYRLADLEPDDGFGVCACDSGDYATLFERCLAEAHWSDKIRLQGRLIDGRYHGLGISCFIEGGGSGPREHSRMVVEQDGSVSVYMGSSAVGQGIETIMAQIAADALEIPFDRVKIYHGSTNYLSDGFGSYGSRSTVMGGSALVVNANALLDKFRAVAARRFGLAEGEVKIAEAIASAPDGSKLTFADVADEGLDVEAQFSNGSKATYTPGTAIAHVAVDPGTGQVDVIELVIVDDVGRIINPLTLHGQVYGAAVQGLGSVFSEELVYDDNGQLLVATLADYMVPTATDYPHLHAVSVELAPSPNNPLGAKGGGEGGIIPVGGAIANAVAAALSSLGVEPRELPLSPPRVWQMIQDAQQRTAS